MLEAKECEDVKRIKAGIISCGNTSSVYLKILQTNPPFEVVTFGDLLNGRAKERVDKLSVENVYKVDGSMLRPEMELAFYLPVPGCQALQMCDTRGGQAGVMEQI
ncbi:hypothetical protein [Paenibacillus polymyxa]|uniref:hypothetical protein n=2 Tax=Paenibacillus TaxID=44249 RepID=UPI0003090C00|nr:hypothetical protein [Paenibacillus polymyxa]KKD53668.1 hypothetical protein C400_14520 [Paenibacillus sp. ICGEB2008]MBE3649478.1 hypothetical protein [Paenibacillus polymyxa]UNL92880.1 hypothetical protein CPY53_04580 [Paenibacillus polymyxa]SEJ73178.1 hypothetical protein SAMN04488600_104138 [Paenibacillus polymyxa]